MKKFLLVIFTIIIFYALGFTVFYIVVAELDVSNKSFLNSTNLLVIPLITTFFLKKRMLISFSKHLLFTALLLIYFVCFRYMFMDFYPHFYELIHSKPYLSPAIWKCVEEKHICYQK